LKKINGMRTRLKELQDKLGSDPGAKSLVDAVKTFDERLAELVAVERGWPPVGVVSLATVNGALGSLISQVDRSDAAPTAQASTAFRVYHDLFDKQMAKWEALNGKELPALNLLLQQ